MTSECVCPTTNQAPSQIVNARQIGTGALNLRCINPKKGQPEATYGRRLNDAALP